MLFEDVARLVGILDGCGLQTNKRKDVVVKTYVGISAVVIFM
jgi:hypothetical protein